MAVNLERNTHVTFAVNIGIQINKHANDAVGTLFALRLGLRSRLRQDMHLNVRLATNVETQVSTGTQTQVLIKTNAVIDVKLRSQR